ncbi:hypothetical protein RSAG8_03999, partial [Rhizoctonia solani AG-8 WAC10335]
MLVVRKTTRRNYGILVVKRPAFFAQPSSNIHCLASDDRQPIPTMSSTSSRAPAPTLNFDPSPNQPLWAPPNRGIYTYSFLGGMALIGFIVLIFVIRAYSRRRRFAIRVQRALDAGRLDPGRRKITPVAVSKLVSSTDDSAQTVSPAEPVQTSGRTSRFNFITSVLSSSRTEPVPQQETIPNPMPPMAQTSIPPTPPSSLALNVFIAMPSPSSHLSRAKLEGEEIVPDVCLGVTRVDVIG